MNIHAPSEILTHDPSNQEAVTYALERATTGIGISVRAAKCKTPHTVVQELVVPSTIEIASVMFDDKIV
jgi:hypothetical protein